LLPIFLVVLLPERAPSTALTMPSGNGAKAKQKRERNAKKDEVVAKSQLKTNEQAKTVICKVLFKYYYIYIYRYVINTTNINKYCYIGLQASILVHCKKT
jgi:hypothetical protein